MANKALVVCIVFTVILVVSFFVTAVKTQDPVEGSSVQVAAVEEGSGIAADDLDTRIVKMDCSGSFHGGKTSVDFETAADQVFSALISETLANIKPDDTGTRSVHHMVQIGGSVGSATCTNLSVRDWEICLGVAKLAVMICFYNSKGYTRLISCKISYSVDNVDTSYNGASSIGSGDVDDDDSTIMYSQEDVDDYKFLKCNDHLEDLKVYAYVYHSDLVTTLSKLVVTVPTVNRAYDSRLLTSNIRGDFGGGFGQCEFYNITRDECRVCLKKALRLLIECFPATTGTVHFQGCAMSYYMYTD